MDDAPKGAILQRDKKTYAIVPRTPAGMVSPEILEGITKVVRQYNIPITKITSGQRLALVGIKKEDINSVWDALQMDVGRAIELCLHYVQACPGNCGVHLRPAGLTWPGAGHRKLFLRLPTAPPRSR